MEKRSYLSIWQCVSVLVVVRLLFATAHFITLNSSRTIQDILPALPINFLLNCVTAVPILLLVRRYGGKDPAECAAAIWGKAGGVAVALLYFIFFGFYAVLRQFQFFQYFTNAIIADASVPTIVLPMLLVVIYGVCKGLESIMRFGSIVFILFLISLVVLCATLIPSIRPSIGFRYLLPLFYNGPGVMLKELMVGFNSNIEMVFVAFLMPFLRSGIRGGKVFMKWNLLTTLLLAVEFTLCIAVLGPFGALQFYPLRAISSQSYVSVFDRLDALYGIVWMLISMLTVMFCTYMQVNCLTRMGLARHRKLVAAGLCLLDAGFAVWMIGFGTRMRFIESDWFYTAYNIFFIIVLPLFLLAGGAVRGIVLKRKEPADETA